MHKISSTTIERPQLQSPTPTTCQPGDRHLNRAANAQVTHLRTDRVDPDGTVQLLLGQSTLERGSKALRNLSGIWTQNVEANHTFLK